MKQNRMLVILVRWFVFTLTLLVPFTAFASGGGDTKPWYTGFAPIVLLLVAVGIVMSRLKRPEGLPHLENKTYRLRRVLNWVPLGLTYAFLYWGRYNLQPIIEAVGGKSMVADFGWVFGAGTAIYGISFIVNGPLTDRKGGRFSILVGAIGASIANLLMGCSCYLALNEFCSIDVFFWSLMILYPINMYFQSFGAVAIVKCNAPWFHVKERGVFGAVFGIMISLGIYFAFDWSYAIVKVAPANWAFWIPAIALAIMFVVDKLVVRNTPEDAGFKKVITDDASEGVNEPQRGAKEMFKLMLNNKVILIIACIEFCSGFLRQAIMQMYRFFANQTDAILHLKTDFVYENWGLCLCVAGILGGVFAGTISDRVFGSRRAPVVAVLYFFMLLGSVAMIFLMQSPTFGWLMVFMSMCIIGVHGMLSGTASMDFGGTKNVGVAVGLIDGFVYAGTATQAVLYAITLPKGDIIVGADPANWSFWPLPMIVIAVIGLYLAIKIWFAKPKVENPRILRPGTQMLIWKIRMWIRSYYWLNDITKEALSKENQRCMPKAEEGNNDDKPIPK